MTFNILSNQHAVFVPVPVDAAGNPASATGVTVVSSDPTILEVLGPDAGINTDFDITCHAAGNVTLTVSGTNGDGAPISTDWTLRSL